MVGDLKLSAWNLDFKTTEHWILSTVVSDIELVIPIRFSGEWTFYISVKKTTVRNIELFTNHKGVVVSIDSCIYNY